MIKFTDPSKEPPIENDSQWEWVRYHHIPQVRRMSVPGGWLYIVGSDSNNHATFVPEPVELNKTDLARIIRTHTQCGIYSAKDAADEIYNILKGRKDAK